MKAFIKEWWPGLLLLSGFAYIVIALCFPQTIDVFMAETAALREEKNKLGHFNVHVMERANKAEAALRQIMAIKDDTLGKREGVESEGTKDFDRGCRMAFYRCAEIARNALS